MSKTIEIKGNGSSVSIIVDGYENPAAQNSLDANWLRCGVSLKGAEFTAQFRASFTTHDFYRFANELQTILKNLTGQAVFIGDEDALHLKMDVTKTGIINVEAIAKSYTQTKIMITFVFNSDPSFINQAYEELKRVLEEYPIKA